MSWIDQSFEEFGRTIGVAGLRPREDGRLSLRIGAEQRLDFVVLEDAVLMLLVRPFQGGERLLALRRAFDACHLRHGWSTNVRAGLTRGGDLIFLATLPAREFRPNTVEQAFNLLARLHERVAHR